MIHGLKLRLHLSAFLLLASAAILAVIPTPMRAQTAVEAAKLAAEAAKTAGALPEGSRAVIVRLSNLRVLPDGVWKMHSGDLAHGRGCEPGRVWVESYGAAD